MVILQTRLLAILHLFLGCEEVGNRAADPRSSDVKELEGS